MAESKIIGNTIKSAHKKSNRGSASANLYFYNAGNEPSFAIANAVAHTPSSTIRKMRRDLAALPAWTAKNPSCDAVLVPSDHPIALPYPQGLIPPARLLTEQMLVRHSDEKTFKLILNGLEPPLVRGLKKVLQSQGIHNLIYPPDLFGKDLGATREAEILRKFHDRSLGLDFLLHYFPHLSPQRVFSREQLLLYAEQATCPFIVIKQPFSSSGRGVFAFTREKILEALPSSSASKFPCTAEPFYEKCSDWASEFTIGVDRKVHFLGLSHFQTKGFRYSHNIAIAQKTLWELLAKDISERQIEEVLCLQQRFLEEKVAPYYVGDVGVDMLVYRTATGERFLHPCCEFNIRTTMGHLALRLFERYGALGHCYHFAVKHFAHDGAAALWQEAILASTPPIANRDGKLRQGVLPLSNIDKATRFVAFLVVENTLSL